MTLWTTTWRSTMSGIIAHATVEADTRAQAVKTACNEVKRANRKVRFHLVSCERLTAKENA